MKMNRVRGRAALWTALAACAVLAACGDDAGGGAATGDANNDGNNAVNNAVNNDVNNDAPNNDAPNNDAPNNDVNNAVNNDPNNDVNNEPALDCPVEGPTSEGVVVFEQGAARGVAQGGTTAFLGLPYVAPPVGALRWRPPQRAGCFQGTFDATTPARLCPQLDGNDQVVGQEDCLQLNLWTPTDALTQGQGRPVMVFIPGGGNVQGGASVGLGGELLYHGQSLAENHDVLVVAINYRLGPLGWFTHPELDAEDPRGVSGNYGLLDQIAALEWVQRNIAAFGGDPGRVMIFGESAGARNTCALVASPLAAGLFEAAVMQSGACLLPERDAVLADSMEQVERSGCAGVDDTAPNCLRARTPAQLLEDFPTVVAVAGRSGNYQPYPDGHVLMGQPEAVIAAGEHNEVIFVAGANADETSRSIPPVPNERAYQRLVEAQLGVELAARALEVYPASDFDSPEEAYIQLTTDARFVCQARRAVRAASAGQQAPVYRYFFDQNLSRAPRLAPLGAWHGLDLFFVFDRLTLGNYRPSPEEQALADAMGALWAGIATDGVPDSEGAPEWTAYDPERDNQLILQGGDLRMEDGVRAARCDFWDSLLDG